MLSLFRVMGISHRVQLAILVNFPNAVLNVKRFYNHLKILISIVPLNNMPNKTSLSSIAVDKYQLL